MSVMAKEMDKNVGLKDLYRMEDGKLKTGASGLPILARSAEKRSIGIVRTEVTRLANEGAVSYYKENKIKQVRWLHHMVIELVLNVVDLMDKFLKLILIQIFLCIQCADVL